MRPPRTLDNASAPDDGNRRIGPAFPDNNPARTKRSRIQDQTMPQNEPRTTVAASRLIEQLMKTILRQSPGMTRVRLAVVHGGTAGCSLPGTPRYDVTNSVAARSRPIGPLARNQPLSDWTDFLPALLASQCALHQIPGAGKAAPPSGLASSCATTILACPVTGAAGDLMGAIFIMWDGNDRPPEARALHRLMQAGKQVAAQIAAVLNLCGQASLQVFEDFFPLTEAAPYPLQASA